MSREVIPCNRWNGRMIQKTIEDIYCHIQWSKFGIWTAFLLRSYVGMVVNRIVLTAIFQKFRLRLRTKDSGLRNTLLFWSRQELFYLITQSRSPPQRSVSDASSSSSAPPRWLSSTPPGESWRSPVLASGTRGPPDARASSLHQIFFGIEDRCWWLSPGKYRGLHFS